MRVVSAELDDAHQRAGAEKRDHPERRSCGRAQSRGKDRGEQTERRHHNLDQHARQRGQFVKGHRQCVQGRKSYFDL